MAKFRVKAFFMHEHEADLARRAEQASALTDTEWTDGYVIAVVDESEIPALARGGLVITPIERVEESGASRTRSGGRRTRAVPAGGSDAMPVGRSLGITSVAAKILSPVQRGPQFYVVQLNGPLTERRRGELRERNISLLERLSNNKYTARLDPGQVRPLAQLAFVDSIRLYGEPDTLRTSRGTRRVTRGGGGMLFTLVHAVRLHRAEDVPAVTRWLAERQRRPLWTHDDVLHVALPQGGAEVTELAKLPEVATVEEILPARPLDRAARQILRLEGEGIDLGLEGEGEIIGIADTGLDLSHPDFQNRIVGVAAWGRPGPPGDTSDPEGHGTHVAGCALGNGGNSGGEVRGAAPKAKLFFQSVLDANGGLGGLPKNLSELFDEAYRAGARIHNNSWGAFSYARYSATSLDVDRFVHGHPDMLIVIAAGNDGLAVPRVKGGGMNAKAGFVDWPCVAAPATAKNGLTVGASRNSRKKGGYARLTFSQAWQDRYPKPPIGKEFISGNPECLAAFSSRGPADESRIKPDLVAPGTDIAAARSSQAPLYKFWGAYPNNPLYAYMGGTSMAAPYVAGCAALVREYFVKSRGWPSPSAALLKAILLNGTRRLTGSDAQASLPGDPNFHQGFGLLDMAASIPNQLSADLHLEFVDTWTDQQSAFQKTGERMRWEVTAGNKLPLRICLAWTDVPLRGLQNRLFLLTDNKAGEKFAGNSNAAVTVKTSGMTEDSNNNVQVVRVMTPRPGDFTIAVTASELLQPPQHFALVVTGDLQSPLRRLP